MRRALWIGATISAGVCLMGACRSPTQMTITVRYGASFGGCASFTSAQIYVGTDPTTLEGSKIPGGFTVAEATTCNDALVGTLVLTPNDGDRGAIAIVSGVGVDPRTCKPPSYTGGCIVARRAFSFVSHTRLEMPIDLDLDCKDVPCTASTTCRHGACVSSDVSCSDDGSCVLSVDAPGAADAGVDTDRPQDATADGEPSDASVPDASLDGSGRPDGGLGCGSALFDAGACTNGDVCCYDETNGFTCRAQADCHWQIRKCNGAADCAAGLVCCADLITSASAQDEIHSSCRTRPCDAGREPGSFSSYELCTDQPTDCNGQSSCVFYPKMPGEKYCQ